MPPRPLTLTLTGKSLFLMDRDNISFAEEIATWTKDPANADSQKPGDDRAPAWGWLGKLHYGLDDLVGIPEHMLSPCIRAAGAMIPHPSARGGKTLKEPSQSGIQFAKTSFPLWLRHDTPPGWHTINYKELHGKLRSEDDFSQHEAIARSLGFIVDVRRSKPQYNRSHIRVRPAFGNWACICDISVNDDILTDEILVQLFTLAGKHKGIGNWRPSAGKAGSYGQFEVQRGVPRDLAAAVEASQQG